LEPNNPEALLLSSDVYERMGDKASAIFWYLKSLQVIKQPEARKAIEKRIEELRK